MGGKENPSASSRRDFVREFAIRRPTRRITQDTAFGGMRREFRCANICTLCAWQTSLPIFERQMRTQRRSSPGEIPRTSHQEKKQDNHYQTFPMILLGAYRLRYIAKRADVSRNCTQRNEWKKENASGKQVREFAIRRPTRRITQDTAFGGMRTPCANKNQKIKPKT